ncbi:putative wall-associated receptor kinase-like 16 [Trifolium pratense]|uniref:putative wall-associated receptor kinase-like 16 n=1 Tax=Trifolium pratense TaxID=57577 RepID=UPI001E693B5B|nr:putative wall-associated receptor kinase-like 16 [Trifolium pratense]
MTLHIKQFLLIAVVAVLYTKASTQPMSLPNCPSKCGSVTIPYPFGTTKDCSLDNTFLINCSQTSLLPFFQANNSVYNYNISVLNISLNGELRVAWPIASDCYNEKGKPENEINQEISLTYFHISPTRNKFIAVGCDIFGALDAFDSWGNHYATGCVAYCNKPNDTEANQSCSGIGCCEISIPQGHHQLLTKVVYIANTILDNNHSSVHDFNPCGYAFLVEKGYYSFKPTDLSLKKKEFPVVLNWALGNQTCQQSKKNHSSYACNANSTCHNVGKSDGGYICRCFNGYRGNPYLHHDGCQDINECMEPNDCVKKATCVNLLGSYQCLCPAGSEGDGKKKGTRCTKKLSTKQRKDIILIIALSVSLSLVALLVGSFYAYFALKKRKLIKLKEQFFQQNGGLLLQQQIGRHGGSTETAKVFTLGELNEATNNFDEGKILGQGGQGTVYKGVLQDKRIVAIKKSKINDPDQIEPFINEVVILSQINHRNVVKLFGCCLETEVPLLVYEFIPNGTVHKHLHDKNQSIKLTWKTRLRIAKETAGVLAYLHSAASTPIIHRDVKSTNILLDSNLTAKVSDFGASRIVPLDHSQINTLVQGTLGYLDPEYLLTSQLTEKSDVYSFGVVLAELLTGMKALSSDRLEVDRNLAAYFGSSMKAGRLLHILDKSIDMENIEQLKEVAQIAERCLRVKGEDRPTMKEVAMELEGILVIEEHRMGSDNLSSEETENLLKNVEDGISGSGINSSDPYSLNQMSMSTFGGR